MPTEKPLYTSKGQVNHGVSQGLKVTAAGRVIPDRQGVNHAENQAGQGAGIRTLTHLPSLLGRSHQTASQGAPASAPA